MARLHLLGTGAAVSEPHRTTTMLAFSDEGHAIVVDCGGDVIQRLLASDVDIDAIDSLVVTHEHPDHVSGFPLFMEKIWLAGRRRPLPVYGIAPALNQARRIFEAFDTSGWKGLPEIDWREVTLEEEAPVFEDDRWTVTASPGRHAVPVIGLRVESKRSGGIVAYSCDTEPHEGITKLARGADILVHEANGEGPGHSSAEQAAAVAAEAGAKRLILVHLPPDASDRGLEDARGVFEPVELGEELGTYSF